MDKEDLFRRLETLIILRNYLISFSCKMVCLEKLECDVLGCEEESLLAEVLIMSSFSQFIQYYLFSIHFALKPSLKTKDWMRQPDFDFFVLQSYQARTNSF